MIFFIKLLCSLLIGASSGYCMPYLIMFALNLSKGNGINLDGKIFQLPSFILIVMVVIFCFFIEYKLFKNLTKPKCFTIVFIFLLTFCLLFVCVFSTLM